MLAKESYFGCSNKKAASVNINQPTLELSKNAFRDGASPSIRERRINNLLLCTILSNKSKLILKQSRKNRVLTCSY